MAPTDPKHKGDKSKSVEQGVRSIHVVRCPTCRKSTRFDPSNPFRPFCSAVCKNEDIVGWAEEKFRVPGKTAHEDDESAGMPATRPRPMDDGMDDEDEY